jgi:PAS domain S-box-containing protein
LAREIKSGAIATERDVAVVLISAFFTETEYRVQGLESGADAYLIEPISDAELVATVRAVSRRLDQVKVARENARLLDALFEYIPEGITVADAPDVKIRRVSRFGQALSGRFLHEVASEQPAGSGVFRAGGVTAARHEDLPLTRAVTAGELITDEEWVIRRPDGQQIIILCNAGPIKDADGRITGGVIAWRDITARKEIQDALVRRTKELREADQTKNDFLATVVHELRQPLQAAVAAVGMMKARVDRRTGERARDVIERQMEQMSRITSDLLDAARVVRRQVELRREPTDLRDILRRALETVRPAMTAGEHQVSFTAPEMRIGVYADAARLQQVFVNILSNAARYTEPGGRIDVSCTVSDVRAEIRVKDTGAGIPPENLARIFDLFTRASDREGGFGIGLAVARTLIEEHGGSVRARSEGAGRGSEFIVSLPLTSETEGAPG